MLFITQYTEYNVIVPLEVEDKSRVVPDSCQVARQHLDMGMSVVDMDQAVPTTTHQPIN